MRKSWWKILAVVLISLVIIAGLLAPVPVLPILHESIRNVFFHVPMWTAMLVLYFISVIYSIKYLNTGKQEYDFMAVEAVNTGITFCFMGLATGMLWANITWGDPWPNDPKLNGSAIATLMYLAYLVLRNALEEEQKRAKISAVYNIFSFPIMIVLLYILPKLTDSLHPGSGGNSTFGTLDMNNQLRPIFYTAVIGWILIGAWMLSLRYRMRLIESKQNEIN
ncbi:MULTISPECIES: cytochrome c biogenesis protein CcsA [Sphingobacterium]|jgi:heme exporter protein C|uniref:cytochrome c biogenesis protein CcsA n=1 Tax=Sphingobacterium TaxID=28453 RepID=UPI0004E5FB01|nr:MULTISPECIES: cytochrome c biogenesis protein CcsA [Sphingobacterium]CDT16077.1 Heme exporter protein C [Sphingobacterium sp. PM2-P1-29]SJN29993.1 Cytochrome c-type biogenesis protein CcmC, putative heme lyase for CcmE [Sphingobacterium faecium PCAi_F2.5]UPZ37133.1 cytochrome c biogenesis protein [Sphingobacterium sp. PCS056]UXD68654.1 cytochrome c biogenesis protein [Sphingobacterium faecium]WGQ16367.1 cytochrome c biogenesis protein CcsA [Sphingobacterium faecium]